MVMSGYVFPCENNGQCARLLYESYGWNVKIYSLWGTRRIFGVKFKCCTRCHLPLNKKEADRLNKELGYSLNDVVVDPTFLELLNGIE